MLRRRIDWQRAFFDWQGGFLGGHPRKVPAQRIRAANRIASCLRGPLIEIPPDVLIEFASLPVSLIEKIKPSKKHLRIITRPMAIHFCLLKGFLVSPILKPVARRSA
jgi:hypothetical protein